jgi:hypothetical protein
MIFYDDRHGHPILHCTGSSSDNDVSKGSYTIRLSGEIQHDSSQALNHSIIGCRVITGNPESLVSLYQ